MHNTEQWMHGWSVPTDTMFLSLHEISGDLTWVRFLVRILTSHPFVHKFQISTEASKVYIINPSVKCRVCTHPLPPPPLQKKGSLTYFLSQPCFTALSLCQGHIIWLLSKYIPIPIANVAYRAITANVLSTYLILQALPASPPWGSVSRKRRLKAVPRLFVTSVILVTSQQGP